MPQNSDFKNPEHRPEDAEELELVRAARQAPEAFGALYLRYVNPIFRYLCSRTGNVQEAEDLTSQTFITALQAIPQIRHEERFASWLFTIARNKAMDHFRKQRSHPEVQTDDPQVFVKKQDLTAAILQSERVRQLSLLLEELDEEALELLRLRFLGELTFKEMAETLHRSPSAVKKSFYRLLARLKSQLEDSHE